MVDSSSQITIRNIEVTFSEQTDTVQGERTNFAGNNFRFLNSTFGEIGFPLKSEYMLSVFTTGAISGVTVNYHYRRVRVPSNAEPFVISDFFTNVQIGFDSAIFVIPKKITDEYIDYDVFFSYSAVSVTSDLDLYVQTDTVPNEDTLLPFPNFPNSTDPLRGDSLVRSIGGTNRVFDTFLVAQPPP